MSNMACRCVSGKRYNRECCSARDKEIDAGVLPHPGNIDFCLGQNGKGKMIVDMPKARANMAPLFTFACVTFGNRKLRNVRCCLTPTRARRGLAKLNGVCDSCSPTLTCNCVKALCE